MLHRGTRRGSGCAEEAALGTPLQGMGLRLPSGLAVAVIAKSAVTQARGTLSSHPDPPIPGFDVPDILLLP